VTTLTSLLADKTDIYAETTLTNQRYTATYVVDRNFDRVFDAKDKEVAYHLNIAVLTSAFSFSCGNLFPALMKGYGTLIIGEKSGGGACAIQQMCTADGFDYRISSFRCRLCDANGKNIDGGVEPQKALLRDQFYDLGVLEQNIVDYYHKK
jgi:C-terminal processing protease CtpA/Prc